MKIKTEVVIKEQLEVNITPEELAKEIGRILKGYGYYIYDSEPELQVNEGCDEVNIEIYKSEVEWEGLMTGPFAKDLMDTLQTLNDKQKGATNETTN